MANRESSPELSSLAAKVLKREDPFTDPAFASLPSIRQEAMHDLFDQWVQAARRLAGSVMSQDETPGQRKIGKSPALAAPYGETKIPLGLRQVTHDIQTMQHQHQHVQSPVAVSILTALDAIVDRINGYAAELEHDAKQPSAGTHAYEVVAAAEQAHVETTETLIHMIAATVLMRSNVLTETRSITFGPSDMDEMHRRYDMSAVRDGMNTTVTIRLREGQPLPSLAAEPGIDDAPAEPQAAEHVYNRPVWAVRVDGLLYRVNDRAHAERRVTEAQDNGALASIENRYCIHPNCPAEHCNEDNVPNRDSGTEATSGDPFYWIKDEETVVHTDRRMRDDD